MATAALVSILHVLLLLCIGSCSIIAPFIGTVEAAREDVPCECWNGVMDSIEPCQCSCDAGWQQPYCAYKADDIPTLMVVTTWSIANKTEIFGSILERKLALGLGLNYAESGVIYLQLDETSNAIQRAFPGYLIMVFGLPSAHATSLMQADNSNAQWLRDLNVQYVNVRMRDNSKAHNPFAGGTIVDYNGAILSLADIMWLLLVVVMIFLMLLECGCCLTNITDVVEIKVRDDIRDHKIAREKQNRELLSQSSLILQASMAPSAMSSGDEGGTLEKDASSGVHVSVEINPLGGQGSSGNFGDESKDAAPIPADEEAASPEPQEEAPASSMPPVE